MAKVGILMGMCKSGNKKKKSFNKATRDEELFVIQFLMCRYPLCDL